MFPFLFELLEAFLSDAANPVNMHADNWRLTLFVGFLSIPTSNSTIACSAT